MVHPGGWWGPCASVGWCLYQPCWLIVLSHSLIVLPRSPIVILWSKKRAPTSHVRPLVQLLLCFPYTLHWCLVQPCWVIAMLFSTYNCPSTFLQLYTFWHEWYGRVLCYTYHKLRNLTLLANLLQRDLFSLVLVFCYEWATFSRQYLERYYCCSSSFVVLVAHWNCVTAIYPFANVAIVGTIVNGICIFAEQMHGQCYVGWHKSSRNGFPTAI